MKVPKEEAGLWNWGTNSQQKLGRNDSSGADTPAGGKVRTPSEEDAHCERRSSRAYRRPSNDRHASNERDREHTNRSNTEQHRDRDANREKEPSIKREQRATCSNSREPERDRGSDGIKKRTNKAMRYNPGPLTRNPYLNFMREFRKHNTGENILDITKQGAKAWKNLPVKEKEEFACQARRVPPRSYKKKKKNRRRRFF